MNKKTYSSLHNHTSYSNIRLRDAIIKVPELIDKAKEIGLNAIAITDHEALSSHVKAKKYFDSNKEKLGDMKLILGNEIYLVDKEEVNDIKEKNGKIFFNHFILLAKNRHGYEGLMKLSTKAWENSFFYRGMQRVPTYYDELKDVMSEYKGDIIASTACLGGIIPKLILEYNSEHTVQNYQKIIDRLSFFQEVFGKEDFYLELQPSNHEEQQIVNSTLIKISSLLNIKKIVTTDTHYLSKEQKEIHKIYLQSNGNDGREVDDFYDTTYMMDVDELKSFFDDDDLLQDMFDNTNAIASQVEEFDLFHKTIIPQAHIPEFKELQLSDYPDVDWNSYPLIKYYEKSEYKSDKYYIKLIIEGLTNHNLTFNHINLNRINTELDVVKSVGDYFNSTMSSYFLAQREFIDITWQTSLVGVSRGSASSFFTNYLLDIVQINALDFDLPYWRFLNKDRLDNMPDIDTDAESSQRENIINNVKDRFGEHNVINVGTFTTEGTRSAVLTACRGVGISVNEANNILDLIPNEKGVNWSLQETINGTNDKQPVYDFIALIEKYPYLKETMLAIEGIISGVSVHASAVVIMNDGYTEHFPSMKTSNGVRVSQYDAHDVEYVGGLKFDFLSIDALSRIRSAMDLLVKEGKINWKGSIKATYDKYLHPDNINVDSKDIYRAIYNNEVPSIFQFSTNVGLQGLQKVHPQKFNELAATNSLIRLTTDGEQPIDKYIKFKGDINLWYQEMRENHLSDAEMNILKRILGVDYGILNSQEKLMEISMDEGIANFTLKQANKLRKSVAKKDPILQEKEKTLFFNSCADNGTTKAFAEYIWDFCIAPTLNYSFSSCHVAGYSLIAIIEAYISAEYGSIYWKTASLSVDAGVQGDEFDSVDYTKLSRAVANSKSLINLPDINHSEIGFVPKNNRILFGLGAISGIGINDINSIIENRPYKSLDDFVDKNKDIFSTKKMLILIKSGLFHEFNSSTKSLAVDYIYKNTPRKKKLTTVQLPKIINDVPDEFMEAKKLYLFKSKVFGRNAISDNKEIEKEFFDNWKSSDIKYDYVDGEINIDKKSMDNIFNKISEPMKEWLKTSDAIEILAKVDMRELWIKEMQGNEASWYFSTLSYYPFEHQLKNTGIVDDLNIRSFYSLPVDGTKIGNRKKYEKTSLAGTVISKNIKGVIDIITTDNEVVSVRVGKDNYSKYNKKIMEGNGKDRKVKSDSFFNRGETLLFVGYRRMNDFIANNYGTGYEEPVMKIIGYNNFTLEVR